MIFLFSNICLFWVLSILIDVLRKDSYFSECLEELGSIGIVLKAW